MQQDSKAQERHASTVGHLMTTNDQKRGYSATRAALSECSSESLITEYSGSVRDSFGMFGHNAATWGNLCADELLSRGITHYPNIFGPIEIKSTLRGPVSRGYRFTTTKEA